MSRPLVLPMLISALMSLVGCAHHEKPATPTVQIVCAPDASPSETLAAREVRRYLYLRTGQLLPITNQPGAGDQIIVARKDRQLANHLQLRQTVATLQPQQYVIKTIDAISAARDATPHRTVYLVGGDDTGTLYAAYRFAEHIGIAFDLDSDVVPDQQVALELPKLNETGKPLFDLRGIQPFHDFPEGPDWWNTDHYKAIIAQLPKLRMNFFGLHTYPEGGVGPEPTVWIGLPKDLAPDGTLNFSYTSSWQNTLRGNWGYHAKPTSDWSFGSSMLFDHDAFGSDVMIRHCPSPQTPEARKEVFDLAGDQLREAFTLAHSLGIKTCVGTETPLIIPKLVRDRMNTDNVKDVQTIYEGIFQRIACTYPLDYYWFWTPEDWTWSGVSDQNVKKTIDDMQAAIAAAKKVNAPFALATCGWVLGPPNDRALFDTILPKNIPVSCINREVGKAPVEPGFAKVQGRGKWAIPWLEDDPNLLMPQLWVGRMRKDAADSLKYGCTGLMGIHWRTRITSPNAVALANAAWNQSPWNQPATQPSSLLKMDGAVGGQYADFPNNPIADTDDPAIYQTVRYDVDAYYLAVPNGEYTVTLQFSEPHYAEPAKRVFGVKLQGKPVIDKLDIFAKVGKNRPLNYSFPDIEVANGFIDIDFFRDTEFPSIAGIVIQSPTLTRKINCGGSAHKDYAADFPPGAPGPKRDRFALTADFYHQWATTHFGHDAARDIADIFTQIDGRLPETSSWTDGPGGLAPNTTPWQSAAKLYTFVDDFAALRPRVKGPGNLQRFDYWLNSFRCMRATEHAKCLWTQFNDAMKKVAVEKDPAQKAQLAEQSALLLRIQIIAAVTDAYNYMLATVQTPGELGTVANWEQHVFPAMITNPGKDLAAALGRNLPDDARPSSAYTGPFRIIVPTLRGSIKLGESLQLRVLLLSQQPPTDANLFWRTMGHGSFTKIPLTHIARGIYNVAIPTDTPQITGIEYYIEATAPDKQKAIFPASAPRISQTVIVAP
ncbi:MAG: malectin domain-containing carbohydrate-binding protein [Planctomycetota bacterium]|nr:malectin domain-containing carbohydrate-binding protein [Planctomycetota bacterium]